MKQIASKEKDLEAITVPIAIFLLAVIFVIVMALIGMFDFSPTDPEAKVIAASLALVGVFFTSAISLIGYLLRRSFDNRTLALQHEAEERLRLETVIQAVGLLSSPSGEDVSNTQKAGVLYTLASLGQMEFSLALLDQMLNSRQIDVATSDWLLNIALESNDQNLHVLAANIYTNHLDVFTEGEFYLPEVLKETWNVEIDLHARYVMFKSLLSAISSRLREEWTQNDRLGFLITVCGAFINETSDRIKHAAAASIMILSEIPELSNTVEFGVLGSVLELPKLKAAAFQYIEDNKDKVIDTSTLKLLDEIVKWGN